MLAMKPWRAKPRLTSQQWPVTSTPLPAIHSVVSLGAQVSEPPTCTSGSTLMLGYFWLKILRPLGTPSVLKGFLSSPQVLQRMVTGPLICEGGATSLEPPAPPAQAASANAADALPAAISRLRRVGPREGEAAGGGVMVVIAQGLLLKRLSLTGA